MFSYIPATEKVEFAQTMTMMVGGGIVVTRALGVCSEQTNSKEFRRVLDRIRTHVEGGMTLTQAFTKELDVFGQVSINLIHAGESSGTLGENFATLARWLERDARLRREVSQATLYPKIVFVATLLVATGLATFILPRLIPLFSGLSIELPLATRILIGITEFLQSNWLVTIMGIVALIMGGFFIRKIPVVRTSMDALFLQLPFVGSFIRTYQLSVTMHILSTLYASGLSLTQSLQAAANACTNTQYRQALTNCMHTIEQGNTLSSALEKYPALFNSVVRNSIAIGEETGKLQESLARLAHYYEEKVSATVKQIPTIIEPILLIIMALVVGFIALAILLPIYEFTQGAQL